MKQIEKTDSKAVHKAYERWPDLARKGFGVGFSLPRGDLHKAYVLGMGGSAAGGDIVASWLAGRPALEMAVFKGQLSIGDMSDTLAIAVSASGETEETIEMMKTAVARGATVVSISSGGTLMDVSRRLGVQHVRMPKVIAPRYMLPFIVFACLAVVNSGLGLRCGREAEDAFSEMDAEAEQIGVGSPVSRNPAKRLALSLAGKTPVIYGSKTTRGAGIRFKNVLNENAKVHALFYGIPDAFHNEVEAWEDPRDDFSPVFLRDSAEEDRDRKRTDLMVNLLSRAGKSPIEARGRGTTRLAQLMTLVYRLDMVSYYAALALGRDPYPTPFIDRLKRKP